ncbi:MAG: hypothetical protein COV74_00630 [Candidatus Omnitrophica bacterium CG11_big_fil_rev_8_21_14_0_20_45_26]|uniref:Uncharacterized protein n=1 Tax=Candidatus Abzuiibacterium crystallinum TaxID=1974748 RepID=A0A2H0LST3_9BACT|nr:MAG: hypothetical protein COV74_00630 [Candidatus Omnitrophica bacterium CG11_big_fil_rev_8_21_14_0_20_45_26]PIW64120.1 MAG: hypothetical protein COW12_07490 [Candidatus Omnitrophica bacterium CG12_big_fil_rev_8_21_14_0_65_45_16]
MDKVRISLKHCYGIKDLNIEFDLAAEKMFVVYAPNGTMKTSFAESMRDYSIGEKPSDRVYKSRISECEVVNVATGDLLNKEKVFVIQSLDEKYESAKISTLLVNESLRKEYESIYAAINEKKGILLEGLQKASGIKKGLEEMFAMDIAQDPKDFFTALLRLKSEVQDGRYAEFQKIAYESVFNEKVEALLDTKEVKDNLQEYMKIYESLIQESTFFKRGVLNHANAADIVKSLKDNGYFKADHTVNINTAEGKKEIKTEKELERAIQKEKDNILNDPDLVKSFEKIDKKFKNKDTKVFRDYLDSNSALLLELGNLPRLKQKLWGAYLVANKAQQLFPECWQGDFVPDTSN